MPSSPEPVIESAEETPRPLHLAELSVAPDGSQRDDATAPAQPEWRVFRPEPVSAVPSVPAPAASAPLFEVATDIGVPEDLLNRARAQAQAAGYLEGWARGVRAAEARAVSATEKARREALAAAAQARADRERALAALAAAAGALENRALPLSTDLEDTIVSAALELAEAIVGQALRDEALRAPAAISRVLALAPEGEDVTVRLHPEDLRTLHQLGPSALPRGRQITFVEDASLSPGDAVAACGASEIDGRVAAAVARVRKSLAAE